MADEAASVLLPGVASLCVGLQFDDLPRPLRLLVLKGVPADERLLLGRVSKSWNSLTHEPSLWREVNASAAAGVKRLTVGLLLALSARASGGMESLDVSGWDKWLGKDLSDALVSLAEDNAASLCVLRVLSEDSWLIEGLELSTLCQLMTALPLLRRLDVDVHVDDTADQMHLNTFLLGAAPFGSALRVRRLHFESHEVNVFLAAFAGYSGAASLEKLILHDISLVDAENLMRVVDIVIQIQMKELRLHGCHVERMQAGSCDPALERLLRESSLTSFSFTNDGFVRERRPAPVYAALRANRHLRHVCFSGGLEWKAGVALLEAITGWSPDH